MRKNRVLSLALIVLGMFVTALGQQPARNAPPRPPSLFFREDWKGRPKGSPQGDLPMTQQYVANPNLELKLYGAGAKDLNPTGDAEPPGQVIYVWSGVTKANWILTLRDRNNFVDLSGLGRIRWRTRQRGFHQLRPVIKLADGTVLAGDYTEPTSSDWRETEFLLADVPRWRVLNAEEAVESTDSAWRSQVDLAKVDEVGFTDLSRGAGHGQGGNSAVDWIEVYGTAVKRSAK